VKRIMIAAVLTAAVLVIAVRKSRAEESSDKAIKAAEQWLGEIDRKAYAKSWDMAGEYFRAAVPKDTWVKQLEGVRGPLGLLSKRKLASAKPAKQLPGAPDGEYVLMSFEASYANKASAVETVTAVKEKSGEWRIVGYYIK
jgi:hypothetical protein